MKRSIDDLAFFGGSPEFALPLRVGQPNIGDRSRLLARLEDMLDRHWLTNNGPYVQELEQRLAAYLDVAHVIAVCNATLGLQLAAQALELRGEVIVPSFTFVATVHTLAWQGLTPVFCDIDSVTHNLDAQQVERAITERTSGILGVHAWGQGCAVEALERLAVRYQLALFFDAAHALSCTDQGRLLGNRGRLEVFSFHATKFFNTFEGGAITTDDAALADELRGMRNFGFTGLDRVDRLGINAKMSEASAAMGLTSFESLEAFIAANRANYLVYQEQLAGLPGVKMLHYNPAERNNYQYIVVEIDQEQAGLSRDMLVNILQAENVLARRYFYPGVHCMAPYRELYPDAGTRLPQTEQLVRRVCVLPNGVSLSREAVERVCNLIRFTIENAEKLTVLG